MTAGNASANWPSLVFDLAPRDDTGSPIAGAASATGPIELLQVFAGATGPTGPPFAPSEFSVVSGVSGLQVLTLPTPALAGGTLFINGLAQRKESYVISGTALSLPTDLCVTAGDLITFVYPS